MKTILEKITLSPVIPVLTLDDEDKALKVVEALREGGLTNMEVTLRTKRAYKCIEILKKEFTDILVGVGTVVNVEQLLYAKKLGVDFVVSPGFTKKLVQEAKKQNLPYLPGVVTPSEVMNLSELGVEYMKFFPCSDFGGVKLLKTYNALFPQINFCPTGGINEKNFKEYLQLNNVFCVGGSWLVQGKDMENDDYESIKNRAKIVTTYL